MFTETDIHRIAGHLFLATRDPEIEVVLGERIDDVASATKRDVDIVFTSCSKGTLVGVEVKNEGRPLDTPLIEGLCQKFSDMPTIGIRQIVSTSGYSEPALRKAMSHDVECLLLKSGPLPNFPFVDMTRLRTIGVVRRAWTNAEVMFLEPPDHPASILSLISATAFESHNLRIQGVAISAGEIQQRVLSGVMSRLPDRDTPGEMPIDATFKLDAPLEVELNGKLYPFPAVRVSGVVSFDVTRVPLDKTLYLEHPDGECVSAGVIVEVDGGLLGLSVSPNVGALNVFSIPKPMRIKRPTRERVERTHPT